MALKSASKSSANAAIKSPLANADPISTANPSFMKNKKTIAAIVVILLLLIGAYYARGYFIAATVNGKPISKNALNSELQKQYGKQVMSTLVRKVLILQEANRLHITVSDKEINDQIQQIQKSLASQGQKLDQVLALRGLTMDDLREQIKIQKTIEKIFSKDIAISDKEIDDYVARYNAQPSTAPGEQSNITTKPQITRDQAKQAIQQDKLSAKFQPWIADLEKKAKIVYFVNLQ